MNRKSHRHVVAAFLFLAGIALAACSKSKSPEVASTSPSPTPAARQPAAAASPSPTPDNFACDLLTPEEVQTVQGEPFKSTKPSQGPGPGLLVSQCYFELPTPVNSVVLTVYRKGAGTDARDPLESWRDMFHREHPEREKEKEEGEGEKKGPEKIEGVGDEAFWTGSRVGGALFVLKGSCYIRISVGGAGDQPVKIEKSKSLALSVLKRLP